MRRTRGSASARRDVVGRHRAETLRSSLDLGAALLFNPVHGAERRGGATRAGRRAGAPPRLPADRRSARRQHRRLRGADARRPGRTSCTARRRCSTRRGARTASLALDLAARDAALRLADEHGLAAPFSLFLNAHPETLDGGSPALPVDAVHAARRGHRAGADRPARGDAAGAHAAALGRLGHRARRRRRRLALARADVDPLSRRDQARPAAARRAQAGGRRAGRDRGRRGGRAPPRDRARRGDRLRASSSRWRARTARRSARATCSARPAPLPAPLPPAGRALRLPGGAGDPFGATPWERVTNWRRPSAGPRALAPCTRDVLVDQAAELGETAMVLASLSDERYGAARVERYGRLAERVAFVGVLNAGDALARAPACAAGRSRRTTRCAARPRSSRSRPTSPPAS